MVDDKLRHDRFYVYVIFRPNGVPCYVGKGSGKRDGKHETYKSHNPHLNAIISQANGTLPCVRIREYMKESDAFQLERLLISTIGREVSGGPLVNLTDGGEGGSGAVRSAETLRLMSKVQQGKIATHTQRLKMSIHHLHRRGRTIEEIGAPGFKLTKFQRNILNKPPLTRTEMGDLTAQRNIGNKYGIGNRRTSEGQARVTQSIIQSNKRRNKSGKPTVHKGPKPWLDDGLSRSEWYRRRKATGEHQKFAGNLRLQERLLTHERDGGRRKS